MMTYSCDSSINSASSSNRNLPRDTQRWMLAFPTLMRDTAWFATKFSKITKNSHWTVGTNSALIVGRITCKPKFRAVSKVSTLVACRVDAIWRLVILFSSLYCQALPRTKRPTGNGFVNLSPMTTKILSGVQTCSASSVARDQTMAACSTMLCATVALNFASVADSTIINPLIARQPRCGTRKPMLSQKMWTGSRLTRKYARSARRTLRRIRGVTIWPAHSVDMNFAGFAWATGKTMDQQLVAITSVICTKRRKKMQAFRKKSKSERTPKLSYNDTCGTMNDTPTTTAQENLPSNFYQWSSKNAFYCMKGKAIHRKN